MYRVSSCVLIIAFSAIIGVVPARAVPNAPAKSTAENDRRVCEDITPVGTRLAKKRYCGTPVEWKDRRRQDREALEKAQLGPCVVNGTTCK